MLTPDFLKWQKKSVFKISKIHLMSEFLLGIKQQQNFCALKLTYVLKEGVYEIMSRIKHHLSEN